MPDVSNSDCPVSVEHLVNSWVKSHSQDSVEYHLDTLHFTVGDRAYSVSDIQDISWSGGASWQNFVLANSWTVTLTNGTSLVLSPTQLEADVWDALANLAFPS